MKKLVFESLDELFESKAKKEDKPQEINVKKEKEKIESKKPEKVNQSKDEKATQAIDALKKQVEKAKKPGAFKTTLEKNAKIKEITDKIKVWEKKLKDYKAKK
jgi:hypothetical protein